MIHNNLIYEKRSLIGNPVRKLRKQGVLPAVVYGKKREETLNIQINYNNFLKIFKLSGKTTVLDLSSEDQTTKIPCLVHELDVDPVKNTIRHVDFLEVDLKKKIISSVPIEFEGVSPAIKEFGAVLSKNLSEVEVESLPDKIPHEIVVDLSKIVSLDDVIHVSDLSTTEDYVIVSDPEEVVASLVTASQEVIENSSVETVIETGSDANKPATENAENNKE